MRLISEYRHNSSYIIGSGDVPKYSWHLVFLAGAFVLLMISALARNSEAFDEYDTIPDDKLESFISPASGEGSSEEDVNDRFSLRKSLKKRLNIDVFDW